MLTNKSTMKLPSHVTVMLLLLLTLIAFVCISAQNHQGSGSVLSPLPLVQQTYYSAVSASFGDLKYSLHYEEYYDDGTERLETVGRYYQANAMEYSDFKENIYSLAVDISQPNYNEQCTVYENAFSNNSPLTTRLVHPSIWLLVNASQSNAPFSNQGTTQIRSQCATHYSITSAFNSANIFSAGGTAAPVLNHFLLLAFTMSGAVNVPLSNYAVNVVFDVYLASGCTEGSLSSANGGAIPLRFTLTGVLTDAIGVRHTLDILYDFTLFTFLDVYGRSEIFYSPSGCVPQALSKIPPLPRGPATLSSRPQTLPALSPSGRMVLEFSVSNGNAASTVTAVRVLSDLLHGQDRLDFMANPNENTWNSLFYEYNTVDAENFLFTHGAVYKVNDSYTNSYGNAACTGAAITPNNANPLQWSHAASLESIFANPNFLNEAIYIGRSVIRSITVDEWWLLKFISYNGVFYQFEITLYVTASGWLNFGRSNDTTSGPQLIRIAIGGISTSRTGITPYSLQFDFYVEYPVTAATIIEYYFSPATEMCPTVPIPGLEILPIIPTQYSVTVSTTYNGYLYSLQYTQYVDSSRSLRRIDGRFAGPYTMTVMDGIGSPSNPSSVLFEEWTQNVTLAAGFSQAQLYANLPYTAFQTTGPLSHVACRSIVLPNSTLSFLATANPFELLALADQATAFFQKTTTIRGTLADTYIALLQGLSQDGIVYSLVFYPSYVSASLTEQVIPLTLTMQVFIPATGVLFIIDHNFFDFHANLPENIFSAPPSRTCTQNAIFNSATPATLTGQSGPTIVQFPSYGLQFSMLLELPLFAAQGDNTIYTVRWYADYANPAGPRERFDIQPSFNPNSDTDDYSYTAQAPGVQKTLIYLYTTQPNGGILLNSGTVYTISSSGCTQQSITASNISPLTGVAPGNVFDAFMPLKVTQANQNQLIVGSSATYGGRIDSYADTRVWLDDFYWNTQTTFAGSAYTAQISMYVTVPAWINNPQSAGFSNTRIPMFIATSGNFVAPGSTVQNKFSNTIYVASFQIGAPGAQLFDASLSGPCIRHQ